MRLIGFFVVRPAFAPYRYSHVGNPSLQSLESDYLVVIFSPALRSLQRNFIPKVAFRPDSTNVGKAAIAITMSKCFADKGIVPNTVFPIGR